MKRREGGNRAIKSEKRKPATSYGKKGRDSALPVLWSRS
jgi:hypothetical protein